MRIDNDLTPKVIQCDIQGHNGLAFSPDKRWMFTSDTPNGVIYRTPLDKQGEPGKREKFRRFSERVYPTERQWMRKAATGAHCLTAGVSHGFSPQGEQLEEYRLPVRCPTMVCFGGDDMKTLFITTTRENMEAEELRIPAFRCHLHPACKCGRDEEKSRFIEH